MATRIYRSNDDGRSWSYLSEIRAAKPGGIWEPEFTVGREGALILFFFDEIRCGIAAALRRLVRASAQL